MSLRAFTCSEQFDHLISGRADDQPRGATDDTRIASYACGRSRLAASRLVTPVTVLTRNCLATVNYFTRVLDSSTVT